MTLPGSSGASIRSVQYLSVQVIGSYLHRSSSFRSASSSGISSVSKGVAAGLISFFTRSRSASVSVMTGLFELAFLEASSGVVLVGGRHILSQ